MGELIRVNFEGIGSDLEVGDEIEIDGFDYRVVAIHGKEEIELEPIFK